MSGEGITLEEFLGLVRSYARRVRESLEGVRRLLAPYVRRLEPRADAVSVAVDTAFPRTPVELVGLSVAPVAVAEAAAAGGSVVHRSVGVRVIVSLDEPLRPERVTLAARLLERRALLALLTRFNPSSALIDGEILPLREARSSDELVRATRHLLSLARERGVTLIGIVKRSRTSYLRRMLGLQEHDKAIVAFALRRCEAIEVPHPDPLLSSYGCKVVLYKPPRGLTSAVKAEVCGSLEELAYHACSPGWSGLPWMLDVVDSLAKRGVEAAARAVEAEVRRILAIHDAEVLALPLNPQEGSRQASGTG